MYRRRILTDSTNSYNDRRMGIARHYWFFGTNVM